MFHVKPSNCPFCDSKLDAATDYTPMNRPDEKRPPREGDICVCLHCAEVLEYTKDGSLIQATIKTLMELDKKEHKLIEKTQAWILEKRPKA